MENLYLVYNELSCEYRQIASFKTDALAAVEMARFMRQPLNELRLLIVRRI